MEKPHTYIVTGAAGFIGCNLIRGLQKAGRHNIIAVDRLDNGEKWKNLMRAGISDYYDKDEFTRVILNCPDYFGARVKLLHMGACSSTTEKDARFMLSNNFLFTKTLSLWALSQNIRIAYASSAATYGNGSKGYSDQTDICAFKPLNVYGYSKQLQDIWAQQSGVLDRVLSFKFFNVYGPGEEFKEDMSSVSFKAYHQIKDGGRVKLFKSHKPGIADGEQKRDFIYIKDAVDMVLYCLENPNLNGIYNIGTGRAESFLSLVRAMFGALNIAENILFVDMPEELAEKYQYYTRATNQKLKAAGYNRPLHGLEEAATDYVAYLNDPDAYTY